MEWLGLSTPAMLVQDEATSGFRTAGWFVRPPLLVLLEAAGTNLFFLVQEYDSLL